MIFNSIGFIVFFSVLLLLVFVFDRSSFLRDKSNLLLLVASLVLYATFDYRCLAILIVLIAYTYLLGLKAQENKKYLTIGIVLDILLLGFFKYFNFFVDSFGELFGVRTTGMISIIIPIGISFYVFKSFSYLYDIYVNRIEAEKDLISLSLYISFFPEIVAGPISRAGYLLKQIKSDRKITLDDLSEGIQIFVFGLFKKIVIADNISVFVNEVYRAPNAYSSLTIALCMLAYSVEIYMDFSGYSDMAIGCSKMIGFNIEKNFNLPYISSNVTEFWKRWHITLSSWLMDYVYIPLGGNRKGKRRQYCNLLITMALGGLWHGANWTFVLWGIANGLALIVHKLYQERFGKKAGSLVSVIGTFVFISFTWVLFRADSFSNAMDVIVGLFSFREGINFISSWAIVGTVVMVLFTSVAYNKNNKTAFYPMVDLNTVFGLFLFFVFVGLTIGLAYTGSNPFIYAAF